MRYSMTPAAQAALIVAGKALIARNNELRAQRVMRRLIAEAMDTPRAVPAFKKSAGWVAL